MTQPGTQAGQGGQVFETLAVAGVGLIGGSFAAALRRHGAVGRVLGVGRNPASLQKALAAGLIDEIVSAEQAGARADCVFLSVPVAAMGDMLAQMKARLRPDSVITDGGSTKGQVIEQARTALGSAIGQFVPGHPIAGSDASGPDAADASLFVDRTVVLTPLPENAPDAIERIQTLWQRCGALVQTMTAEDHDRVLAGVSHLPHWVAAAYMAATIGQPDAAIRLAMAGTGFRDFTRIAAGSPEMWRDIFLSNRHAMLAELGSLRAKLGEVEIALLNRDGAALERWLAQASEARQQWHLSGDKPS